MEKETPLFNKVTLINNILASGLFKTELRDFPEEDPKPNERFLAVGMFKLLKADKTKLSKSIIADRHNNSSFSEKDLHLMVSELAEILAKYQRPALDYEADDFFRSFKRDLIEHYGVPKKKASKWIKELSRDKEYKEKLKSTGAFDKAEKRYKKYICLYAPLF